MSFTHWAFSKSQRVKDTNPKILIDEILQCFNKNNDIAVVMH